MKLGPITEREFTTQVRDLARLFGWLRYHTWLSQHSSAGFPDEVLVRPPRVIFAELKSESGHLSGDQEEWLDALARCGQEVYLWRPPMLDSITELLRVGERPHPRHAEETGAWEVAA